MEKNHMSTARKLQPASQPATLTEHMQQALASLHLEGVVLPETYLQDLAEYDAGNITKEECLKRILAHGKPATK